MNCKNCKLFYTAKFNHFTGYCRETDRYVSGLETNCPCIKNLTKFESFLLKLKKILYKLNKSFN